MKISFLALILTSICRHELITFVVNIFSSYRSDIFVDILNAITLWWIFFSYPQTDEVFLEAQIQNITTSPMFMEKVSLEPSIMYNVAELNSVNQAGEW